MEQSAATTKENKFGKFFKNIWTNLVSELHTGDDEFFTILAECAIVAGILFLSLIWKYFVFLAVFVSALFIIKYRSAKSVYFMVFLLPFLNIIRLYYGQLYFSIYLWCLTLLILGIKLLIDFIKKEKKVNWFFTIMCAVLAVYFILPFGPINFTNHGAIYLSLAIVFVMYYYGKDLSFKQIVLVFAFGAFIASFFGFFRPCFKHAKEIIPEFPDVLQRFTGVSNDPNYYSGDMLLILACTLVLYATKKINYLAYPLILLASVFCFKSLSKMMIIIYAILMTTFCIYWLIRNRNKKGFLQVCGITTCFLLSALICFAQFASIFKRLNRDDEFVKDSSQVESGLINKDESSADGETEYVEYKFRNNRFTVLTTGRTNIWLSYFDASTDSVVHILFGNGIGADYIYCDNGYKTAYFSEHNTFVQMFYRLGIVGCLLVVATIISACKKEYVKKFKFYNLMPFIILFGLFMALCNLLSYRISIYITIIALSLVPVEEEKACNLESKEENLGVETVNE